MCVNTLIRRDERDCILMPAVCAIMHEISSEITTTQRRNCLDGVALIEFTVDANYYLRYKHGYAMIDQKLAT